MSVEIAESIGAMFARNKGINQVIVSGGTIAEAMCFKASRYQSGCLL